jgi:hypothetical protein
MDSDGRHPLISGPQLHVARSPHNLFRPALDSFRRCSSASHIFCAHDHDSDSLAQSAVPTRRTSTSLTRARHTVSLSWWEPSPGDNAGALFVGAAHSRKWNIANRSNRSTLRQCKYCDGYRITGDHRSAASHICELGQIHYVRDRQWPRQYARPVWARQNAAPSLLRLSAPNPPAECPATNIFSFLNPAAAKRSNTRPRPIYRRTIFAF